MIKGILNGDDGSKTVFLGVTFQNLDRMREGEPILVRGSEMGLDFNIAIHAEQDEASHLAQFQRAGIAMPSPEKVHPACPDDDSLLLPMDDRLTPYMRCPTCGREFGVAS